MKELWIWIGSIALSHEDNQGGEHFRLYDVNAEAGELAYNETPPATVLTYRCRRGYLHFEG